MTTDLHPCPKCHTPMRTIERNGIHIESCPDCRGVFLDRGELDRLLDLEAATIARQAAPVTPPAMASSPAIGGTVTTAGPPAGWPSPSAGWDGRRDERDDDDDDDDDDDRYDRRDRGRRRRGGFLSELLEGLAD